MDCEINYVEEKISLCNRGETLFQSQSTDQFILDFEKFLIETFPHKLPSGSVVLHAGGVLVDDVVYLFCGPGGAGKTTAVLRCFSTATQFLSDEMIGLDFAGNCYPFPRPLAPAGEFTSRAGFFRKQAVTTETGSFCYGLPADGSAVSEPVSYDRCCVGLLAENSSTITPLTTGRGLAELLPLIISPAPASKRFHFLSGLARLPVNFFRLPRKQINRLGPRIFERIANATCETC